MTASLDDLTKYIQSIVKKKDFNNIISENLASGFEYATINEYDRLHNQKQYFEIEFQHKRILRENRCYKPFKGEPIKIPIRKNWNLVLTPEKYCLRLTEYIDATLPRYEKAIKEDMAKLGHSYDDTFENVAIFLKMSFEETGVPVYDFLDNEPVIKNKKNKGKKKKNKKGNEPQCETQKTLNEKETDNETASLTDAETASLTDNETASIPDAEDIGADTTAFSLIETDSALIPYFERLNEAKLYFGFFVMDADIPPIKKMLNECYSSNPKFRHLVNANDFLTITKGIHYDNPNLKKGIHFNIKLCKDGIASKDFHCYFYIDYIYSITTLLNILE